jgi:hypothetical protein
MLEMRPNCEACDCNLPANQPGALICSFECTWCLACAEGQLQGRCPNCGGDLSARPLRIGAALERHPATSTRKHRQSPPSTAD